jgi:dihydroxyacetone kinase
MAISKILSGTFLTSLSTEGISVTLLDASDPKILEYLDDFVECPVDYLFNKKLALQSPKISCFKIPENQESSQCFGADLTESQLKLLEKCLKAASEALISNKILLNQVDGILADGDTGSTLSRGAEKILKSLEENSFNLKNLGVCLKQISHLFQDHCGGSIGILYSIFFLRASKCLQGEINPKVWLEALKEGREGIMQYGLAELGERTMLDSLNEGEKFLEKYLKESLNSEPLKPLEEFATGCKIGSQNTINMFPKAGRSAYTASGNEERKSNQPDAGALAIEIISQAICESTKLN